jgi:ribosomal protein L11 methyltransferase
MDEWLEVSVTTDGEAAEAVAEALRPFAYQEGVALEQLGDPDDPAPYALDPAVTVKIYLPGDQDTPQLRQRLAEIMYHMNRLYPVPPPAFRRLADADWANAWKAHYHPFRVGRRLWIRPSWTELAQGETAVSDDAVILTLDPGMAFGTGTHPTTQMCLAAVEDLVRSGAAVLDVGTGSGILAVAAAKLGARRVWGMDTERLAVRTAVANAAQNQVDDVTHFWQGTLGSVKGQPWDLVMVNILAPVIVDLLARHRLLSYVAPETGRLVLSGIIGEQGEMVETAVAAAGSVIHHTYTVRDWITFVAGRPA